MLVGRRVDGLCARDLHDVMRIAPQQCVGSELAALMMVGADDGNLVAEVAVEGDDGQVDVAVVLDVQGVRADDQAVHRVAAQHLEEGELGVLLLACRADHRLVAVIVEGNLNLVQEGREEGMGDVGDDDADEVRAVEREVAPDLARDVVELLDSGFDFCPRGG